MEKRRLGKTDLFVNPVGLGCMGLSHAYGTATDESAAIQFLREAYEAGYNFFDTAECYTGQNEDGTTSNNESIVGRALKGFRKMVIIATKFGVSHKGEYLELDSSPKRIRESLEGSLARLQTNYIDLYYQHRIDPKVAPEVVASVMKEFIAEGKIKAWGISEANEEYIRRAHAVCPVTAIQNRYSMLARGYESLFPLCEELGITFVAFSPLGNGFLSCIYNENSTFEKGDFRNSMPQYTEEGFKRAKALIELLKTMAAKKKTSPAQLSLAWMLCKNKNLVTIPGSRKIENMKSNFEAGNVIITKEELIQIDDLLDQSNIPVFEGHQSK
ncbi:MAG: aldo/keto reductase [Anaeroplasmataceae bacterium]|nr:aldo/keto reductase [Anaeroplasmataceae bacterium]